MLFIVVYYSAVKYNKIQRLQYLELTSVLLPSGSAMRSVHDRGEPCAAGGPLQGHDTGHLPPLLRSVRQHAGSRTGADPVQREARGVTGGAKEVAGARFPVPASSGFATTHQRRAHQVSRLITMEYYSIILHTIRPIQGASTPVRD